VQTSGTAPTQCSDTAHLGNLLDLTYGYNLGVADNGNVSQIPNNLSNNRTQTYTYDEMNRTKTALTQGTSGSSCWGLDYSYDIYANLTTVSLDAGRPACTWTTLNAGVDTNNRITNTGFSYDAAGNVLSDGSFNYTWDAESELKTAAGVTYTYDGDGRRVQKSSGKLYWYGATGDILDESDASGNITDEFVFFGGKRIARRNISSGNIYYYLADHLGTARMIVQAGQTSACYDADFDPFGGEHIVANSCPQNYKFTGKERDTETNLDDFEARYYSSQFGRFHSADWSAIPAPVPYADLGNPQTLNLYAYVKNNPMNLTDPTGHQAPGQLVGTGGDFMMPRMRAGGDPIGMGDEIVPGVWEVTVNGETSFALGTEAEAAAYAQAQGQQAQAQNQNENATTRTPVVNDQTFLTRKAAVMAAERSALGLTKTANESGTTDWEYGGWIVKDSKGKFRYTNPLKGSKRGETDIDNMIVPKGFKKVAGYHTHPDSGSWGEGFSPGDVNWASAKKMALYVGMVYSGNVRVYVPGITQWKGYGEITGDLVGNINH